MRAPRHFPSARRLSDTSMATDKFLLIYLPDKCKAAAPDVLSVSDLYPLFPPPWSISLHYLVTVHAYVPSNGICRGFAFKYGKFLLPPVFLRHFRFQKCLSVNSYGKMPLAFILSLQSLPCKNLFIILIILLQKLRRIQTIRALSTLQCPQCRQSSIFFIFACPSGERCFADGERRRSRDIRAQLLISIPAGHGIQ